MKKKSEELAVQKFEEPAVKEKPEEPPVEEPANPAVEEKPEELGVEEKLEEAIIEEKPKEPPFEEEPKEQSREDTEAATQKIENEEASIGKQSEQFVKETAQPCKEVQTKMKELKDINAGDGTNKNVLQKEETRLDELLTSAKEEMVANNFQEGKVVSEIPNQENFQQASLTTKEVNDAHGAENVIELSSEEMRVEDCTNKIIDKSETKDVSCADCLEEENSLRTNQEKKEGENPEVKTDGNFDKRDENQSIMMSKGAEKDDYEQDIKNNTCAVMDTEEQNEDSPAGEQTSEKLDLGKIDIDDDNNVNHQSTETNLPEEAPESKGEYVVAEIKTPIKEV